MTVTPCQGGQGEMRASSSSRKGLLEITNPHPLGINVAYSSTTGRLPRAISGDTLLLPFPNTQMLSWLSGELLSLKKAGGEGGTLWKKHGFLRETGLGSNPDSTLLSWVTRGQLYCPVKDISAMSQKTRRRQLWCLNTTHHQFLEYTSNSWEPIRKGQGTQFKK